MTELDAELPQDVFDTIQELGVAAIFSIVTKTRDPVAGTVTPVDNGTVARKVTPPVGYDKEFIDGTSVLATDEYVLVAALNLTFTPEEGMMISVVGGTRRIESVKPHRSGELVAAYELQLR